jgi:uncharacterized membrane protein YgaE (UPF0421/DUF939 family)
MKFGARILKTGIAITLALYVATLLNFEQPAFAGIAAMFAIQPTVYRSYQTILEQFQSNLIGAALAVLFALTLGDDPFVIGLVAIITIAITIKLNIEKTATLAIVTIIIIMQSPSEDFTETALLRFLVILLGVFCSFLVNLFFIPPKYETKLYHKISNNTDYITQWIRLAIRNDAEHKVLKEDLSKLKESMLKSDQFYSLYKEERNYFRKNEYTRNRKLVLFRQMITTTNKALSILKNLDLHDHKVYQLPEHVRELLQDHLDELTGYHERILLQYIGKVRHESPEEMINDIEEGERKLTQIFLSEYETSEISHDDMMKLFPLIGLIIDYHDQLEHLDMLVNSFHTYHQNENEVEIIDGQFRE